jgi:hypothetical protein
VATAKIFAVAIFLLTGFGVLIVVGSTILMISAWLKPVLSVADPPTRIFLCGKLMRMCQEREAEEKKGPPSFEELTQGEDLALGKELTKKFVGCVVDCLASPGYNVNLQITNGSIVCDYTRRQIRISFDYEVTLDWAGAVHVVHAVHAGDECPTVFRDCCWRCRP